MRDDHSILYRIIRSLTTIAFLVIGSAWLPLAPATASDSASDQGPAEAAALDETSKRVDVVFVLDNSGSMRENDPDFLTRESVMDFASALASDPKIDGRIAVVLFDGRSRLALGLTPVEAATTDDFLRQALDQLDFSGQRTNGPAGIERALYELRQNGRDGARRAIVFLTDGKIDTGDRQKDLEAAAWLRDDLAKEAETAGVRIFGVAFTDAADYQLMQTLARRTQARYFRAFQAGELADIVDEVLASLGQDDFYDLALADARPISPATGTTPSIPNVASGPPTDESGTGPGLLGLIPVALLLVAGALYWRRRTADRPIDPVAAQAAQEMDAPAAQLLDVGGQLGEAGRAIPLAQGPTRIGRDPHNDIVLDDDTISSEHAVIEVHGGRYWLEDRRSTNGTRLGDKRLEPDQRVQLKGGDHIRLADIDLMFVLTGYVPGGATLFVSSVTSPPPDWRSGTSSPMEAEHDSYEVARSLDEARDEAKDDVPVPVEDSGSGRAANVVDLDGRLHTDPSSDHESASPPERRQLSLLPTPESEPDDARESASGRAGAGTEEPAPTREAHDGPVGAGSGEDPSSRHAARAYRDSLDYHLERVAEISPAFDAFVRRAFDDEIRSALSVAAHDMNLEAPTSDHVLLRNYTFDRVRFVICGVPSPMEEARQAFLSTFGGFTRMLAEELQADSFRRDRCEILAVLTFGLSESPWVSLSIVPDEGQDPRIDLLSYEFLTDRERREIDPSERTDLSQSGLG